MNHIYRKELNSYLNNPVGYIIIVLFAVFANFLFIKDLFAVGSASMRSFFAIIPWLMLVFVPAVSMKAIAEERRTNTIETLLALPLSETEIVVGKFLAILTVVAMALALTLALPIALFFTSKLYLPEIIAAYAGTLLFAGALAAISLFFSSLTKNQVVSFLLSALVIFLLLMITSDFTSNVIPRVIQDNLGYFGLLYHLQNFVKGLLDLRSVFYFVSLIACFLFLSVISLERRD